MFNCTPLVRTVVCYYPSTWLRVRLARLFELSSFSMRKQDTRPMCPVRWQILSLIHSLIQMSISDVTCSIFEITNCNTENMLNERSHTQFIRFEHIFFSCIVILVYCSPSRAQFLFYLSGKLTIESDTNKQAKLSQIFAKFLANSLHR